MVFDTDAASPFRLHFVSCNKLKVGGGMRRFSRKLLGISEMLVLLLTIDRQVV